MQLPKIPSFFKTRQPNRFSFEPRYYDERKERMEQRLKDKASNQVDFKSSLRENWNASRVQRRKGGISVRVLLYAIVLGLFAYYFLLR